MKKSILTLIGATLVLSLSSCWEFSRKQHVLDAEANGKAVLVEAESSKKAIIEQARAENEAAELQAMAKIKIAQADAQAEIERAKGVAEANRIIGESLENSDEYLKYLMIQGYLNGNGERIYIPTEAGMPILEAK